MKKDKAKTGKKKEEGEVKINYTLPSKPEVEYIKEILRIEDPPLPPPIADHEWLPVSVTREGAGIDLFEHCIFCGAYRQKRVLIDGLGRIVRGGTWDIFEGEEVCYQGDIEL